MAFSTLSFTSLMVFHLIIPVSPTPLDGKILYTVPKEIHDWHHIDPKDLSCRFDFTDNHGECISTGPEDHFVLKAGFGGEISLEGYTCTGITLTTTTYTSFFGSVSVTFSQSYYSPSYQTCRERYQMKSERPSEYEATLLHPVHESSWMRTVDVSTNSYLIVTGSKAKFDPYTEHLLSSIFPKGECIANPTEGICSTTMEHTLWFSVTEQSTYCDIFEPAKLTRYGKDYKACGYQDSHGFYRSVQGACVENFCGKVGLRFLDGFVMFAGNIEQTLYCTPDLLISLHTTMLDAREEELRKYIKDWKDDCLDVIEDITYRGVTSIRKLGYFRDMVPGPGRAYRISPNGLEAADVVYIPVSNWSEILPNRTCLLINGQCMEPVNDQFFNGITLGPEGVIIIPERDLLSGIFDDYFQIVHQIDVRHPSVIAISDHIERLNTSSIKQTNSEHISPIDFGLGSWTNWALTLVIFVLASLLLMFVAKKLVVCLWKSGKRSGMSSDPERVPNRERGPLRPPRVRDVEVYGFGDRGHQRRTGEIARPERMAETNF
ncbi:glycoprotein [Frog lyssa-like virus 1]|uniref:Glycoprotein n=1 Tax=Frog lyssa-like virus 1 TaxID=2571313 RepID=A0A6G5RSD8_9RHAB|nr:glycoprotein [Frog lyssa-like virus 1]QCF24330.1 glycoprotein [Frog lyssa-like virus 1]QCF24336.1 glycoprotein [Frog lyssa-like virus 1]